MTCFYSYKLRYMLNFSGLMSAEQLLENAFIQTHKNIHHDQYQIFKHAECSYKKDVPEAM